MWSTILSLFLSASLSGVAVAADVSSAQQAAGVVAAAQAEGASQSLEKGSIEDATTGKTPSAQMFTMVAQTVSKRWDDIQNAARKEFNRYRIRHTFGWNGYELKTAEDLIGVNAYYQYLVEPNFNRGEQFRQDIWVVGLGILKRLGLNLQLKITYTRSFGGTYAKWDAITAKPRCPVPLKGFCDFLLPFDADQVKSAMKNGESIRFEVSGGPVLGFGKSEVFSKTTASAGISYTRDALFLVDIYKHSQDVVRLRILGLKNRGTLAASANVSVNPLLDTALEAGGSIFQRPFIKQIKRQLSIGAGISGTLPLSERLFAIDTMMVDYLYSLSYQTVNTENCQSNINLCTAEEALNEVLLNIRKFSFFPLFDVLIGHNELVDTLMSRAKISEALAKFDFASGTSDPRVRHLFKGSIISNQDNVTPQARLGKIGQALRQMVGMSSFVISEDSLGRKEYYLLESFSHRHYTESIFARNQRDEINDVDLLVKASEKGEPLEFLDLVSRVEIRDKNLSGSELKDFKTTMGMILPKVLKTPEVLDYFSGEDQQNAFVRFQYVYGMNAFERATLADIAHGLQDFIENHPDRKGLSPRMFLPTDSADAQDAPGGYSGFGYYVEAMSYSIRDVLNKDLAIKERLKNFAVIKRDPIFQRYVVGEFMTQLIPSDSIEEEVGVDLAFSQKKPLHVGQKKVSNVYKFVSVMRSIISDRSYDLRLETVRDESTNRETLILPLMRQ